jgi:hypothetical protein
MKNARSLTCRLPVFVAGLLAFGLTAETSRVLADSPNIPRSYRVVAPGKKYVFVMVVPWAEEEANGWLSEEAKAEIREIHSVYQRSGMYRNDGGAEPLWTVDWYADYAEIASDGIHLVRLRPWRYLMTYGPDAEAKSFDQEAVSFFERNHLLGTYSIRELVSDPYLLHTTTHFQWLAENSIRGLQLFAENESEGPAILPKNLSDERREYSLSTQDGNRFVFDMNTGKIKSSVRMPEAKPLPPRSYKKTSPGGKFVFVMIAPVPVEEEVKDCDEETAATVRAIRRDYSRSGLYRSDESSMPLWTVDWFAQNVEIASDGVHLIRLGPGAVLLKGRPIRAGSGLDQEAVSFFEKDRRLKTYWIRQVVTNPDRLPKTQSQFEWLKEGQLDDGSLRYSLVTEDGNQYAFDATTGRILVASPDQHEQETPWFVLGVIVTVLLAGLMLRRRGAAPSILGTGDTK